MLKEHTTIPEVQKAIDVLGNFCNDPEMQELARRRLNDEIYKQSMLSAAKDEGRAERNVEIAAAMRENGMSEELISSILNGQPIIHPPRI